MTWNFADQLTVVKINNNGYNAYYNYDGGGQRVRKVIKNGPIKKVRLYLGGVECYRVYTGNTLKEETWTLQIDGIAQVDTKTVDNTTVLTSLAPLIRYQYSDHLGSATLEADENATVISYEEYHPYGTTAYSTYVNGNYSTKRYRFTNKERDDETGLYYFGVRYYAAWLGRWTSSDPGGFVDGLNLYVYVRNNPVNGVDELGYETDPPPLDPNGNALNLPEGSIVNSTFRKESYPTREGGTATPALGSVRSYQTQTEGGGWITHTARFGVKDGTFVGYKAGSEKLDEDADKVILDKSQAEQQAKFNKIYEAKRAESGGIFLGITMGVVALAGAGTLISLLGAGTVAKEGVDFAVDSAWEATIGTPSPFLLGFSDMAEGFGKHIAKKTFTNSFAKVKSMSSIKAVSEGLYRRGASQGSFNGLGLAMQIRNVKKYSEAAGIGLKGIKIRLVRDKDLVGRGVFGYTHPNGKMIDLYPDAFENVESLVKTIGHERTHVFQFNVFGVPKNTIDGGLYETAAHGIEDTFYDFYKLNR